ncbi:MAG: hypothetical protein MZV64_28865 [Ignavibacteriales bacterium]|nr:hypothetical protein [Ignavibacteriales bacterium]
MIFSTPSTSFSISQPLERQFRNVYSYRAVRTRRRMPRLRQNWISPVSSTGLPV